MDQTSYPSAESLRDGFLSKLNNTVNSKVHWIQSIPNNMQNGRWLFIFAIYLCIQPPLQSPPEICSCFNFQLTILILLVQNIIFTIPAKAPFLYTSAIFHLAIFAYNHLNNLHPKYFFYLIHLDNSGCVKGPGS